MDRSLLIPSSFYTMLLLLLTLLLANRQAHGFGGVSMNPLLSSRMVTRGYSLIRTHSERNDKAFLPWNMVRTPTTKHAMHADAVAEMLEMMRSILEKQNDIEASLNLMGEQLQGVEKRLSNLEDMIGILERDKARRKFADDFS
jgi:hypothetical protein